MSMVKLIEPGAYDFTEPAVQEVPMSSRGIIGNDRARFEKRASADILRSLDALREKVASDEVLIHLLAMGATEAYGANRNGDGFKEAACKQYHPTFVKHAMFYRNHQNKDKKKSYGRVVQSAWNPNMKRVELLAALNGEKSAAERNDGFVADRELDKLAAGKEIPVSMACKVAYDVCSYCGNKAPRTSDYCSGTHQSGHCKAGGLRDNIGALVEIDGGIHQLHADNPHPTFFDISSVFRPADRIAYVTGALEKTAALQGRTIKSAELAEALGVSIPYDLQITGEQPKQVQQLIKMAYRLADLETSLQAGKSPFANTYALGLLPSVCADSTPTPEGVQYKFAQALRALRDQHICLPLEQFVEMTTDCGITKAAEVAAVVARELPGIYTRLLATPDFVEKVATSQYMPSEVEAPVAYQVWAQKKAAATSLRQRYLTDRVTRASLRLEEVGEFRQPIGHEKVACDEPSTKLAEEYALYKLSFLGSLSDSDPDLPLTATLGLLQNYVS